MALQGCTRFIGLFRPLVKAGAMQKFVPAASIVSKSRREPDYKKPAPFPYDTKRYTLLHYLYFDGTTKRMDENSRLIVVDGNIGAGKTAFAKKLAEEFDMKYFPEPDMAKTYITSYGYDLRELDPIMPPHYKSCDVKKFYENPYDRNVTLFQYKMFMLRANDYIDALCHILNTGQGVVMDRCVWSDMVFMETMCKAGYVKRPYRNYYKEIFDSVVVDFMRPCLIVYLDVPPEVALQRIKERNDPVEVNSKVLTLDYLANIEYYYKQWYLKELGKHAELLIYDWSNYGDVEVVIEDIERIDFDRFDKYDAKMKDWRYHDDWEWSWQRYMYTTRKLDLLSHANIVRPRMTDVWIPQEEVNQYKEIMKKIPGEKYIPGFNRDMGDRNILFKTRSKNVRGDLLFFKPYPGFI